MLYGNTDLKKKSKIMLLFKVYFINYKQLIKYKNSRLQYKKETLYIVTYLIHLLNYNPSAYQYLPSIPT